jgi:hypothetical protein
MPGRDHGRDPSAASDPVSEERAMKRRLVAFDLDNTLADSKSPITAHTNTTQMARTQRLQAPSANALN